MYQFVKKEMTFGTDISYVLHPSYNTLEEAEAFIQSLNPDLELLVYPQCKGVQKLQKSDKTCYFIKGYRVFSPMENWDFTNIAQNQKRMVEEGMYYLFKLAD